MKTVCHVGAGGERGKVLGKGVGNRGFFVMALFSYFSTNNVGGPITKMRNEEWGRVFECKPRGVTRWIWYLRCMPKNLYLGLS